jgi:hypothetical protein
MRQRKFDEVPRKLVPASIGFSRDSAAQRGRWSQICQTIE